MSDTPGPICGIIMPISTIEDLTEKHWLDVRSILNEAITAAGYSPRMVSEAEDVGVIQKRLVENLYGNAIVVCDVSAKNSNVMFELGMRLAFDKPTVIIKDDQTGFSFDTGQIEHIVYRRDLRYADTVAFKDTLAKKIIGTVEASKRPDYTTFLGHFGTFKVPDLRTETVPAQDIILSELASLREEIGRLQRAAAPRPRLPSGAVTTMLIRNKSQEEIDRGIAMLMKTDPTLAISVTNMGSHTQVTVRSKSDTTNMMALSDMAARAFEINTPGTSTDN